MFTSSKKTQELEKHKRFFSSSSPPTKDKLKQCPEAAAKQYSKIKRKSKDYNMESSSRSIVFALWNSSGVYNDDNPDGLVEFYTFDRKHTPIIYETERPPTTLAELTLDDPSSQIARPLGNNLSHCHFRAGYVSLGHQVYRIGGHGYLGEIRRTDWDDDPYMLEGCMMLPTVVVGNGKYLLWAGRCNFGNLIGVEMKSGKYFTICLRTEEVVPWGHYPYKPPNLVHGEGNQFSLIWCDLYKVQVEVQVSNQDRCESVPFGRYHCTDFTIDFKKALRGMTGCIRILSHRQIIAPSTCEHSVDYASSISVGSLQKKKERTKNKDAARSASFA